MNLMGGGQGQLAEGQVPFGSSRRDATHLLAESIESSTPDRKGYTTASGRNLACQSCFSLRTRTTSSVP